MSEQDHLDVVYYYNQSVP